MPPPAVIQTRTTYVGVSALARETGLSQPYVSKLLARGWPEHEIRERAEWAAYRREVREMRKAEREQYEMRR